MPRSTANANLILDHEFGNTAYTPPSTYWVALFSVAPTPSGGGTEFIGGGYLRVALANNTTNFPNASGGVKAIGVPVTFAPLTADHPDAVAFALFDASSSGNMKNYGLLTPSKSCLNGDVPFFAANTGLIFNES